MPRRLDALVQLSVVSATTATQPSSPNDGDIYLLPSGKSGAAWGAMAVGAITYYRDGAWKEIAPREGWRGLFTRYGYDRRILGNVVGARGAELCLWCVHADYRLSDARRS